MRDLVIVLDRLRSAHNVGNIFRLAEALNAEIIGCGCTPLPPHPKLEKTAMGTEQFVPFRSMPDAVAAIRLLHTEGCAAILSAEPGGGSTREAWNCPIPAGRIAVIFGNEALGVHPEALALSDGLISLPMLGVKNSINVSNAAAAILYAVKAKTGAFA